MGKKAVKQYFNVVIFGITIILLIFTFVGLYGGTVTPAGHTMRAFTTMVLPFIIVCDFLVLIYWAIRRSWFVIIPIIPIVCCWNYIGTMFQFGGKPDNVNAAFTVASYNVRMFNRDGTGVVALDIMNNIQKEGADIVCLQEFDNSMSGDQRSVGEKFKDTYPYQALSGDMVIMSRFPIKKDKQMPFEMSNNGGMWADVKIDDAHTIRVFNVHMETTGINSTLHRAAKNGDIPTDSMGIDGLQISKKVANNIMDNYVFNSVVRGGQAVTIANEKHNSPYPIVLCGDFNDVPYSYTYNTLLGELNDGFREGGHGYAATYRGAKGLFRIDYIFHAEGMKSEDYYTVDLNYSDHNPVFSKITFVASDKD